MSKEPGQMLWEVYQEPQGPGAIKWAQLHADEQAEYARTESAIRSDEAAKVRAATIEECAKVAENRGDEYKYPTQRDYDLREGCFDAARAIRALGKKA